MRSSKWRFFDFWSSPLNSLLKIMITLFTKNQYQVDFLRYRWGFLRYQRWLFLRLKLNISKEAFNINITTFKLSCRTFNFKIGLTFSISDALFKDFGGFLRYKVWFFIPWHFWRSRYFLKSRRWLLRIKINHTTTCLVRS